MSETKDFLKYIDYPFIQDDRFLKVNTDTVSLGMFLDPLYNKTVLDIGTNTGALLLYCHYKKAGKLIGVEMNSEALKIAAKNLENFTSDYQLISDKIQQVQLEKVDVIVSNPPFFENNSVRQNENMKNAMFEETLPLEELFQSFKRLIKDNGEIYFIYEAPRFPQIYQMCLNYRFKIIRMQFIYRKDHPYATRILLKLKIGKMNKLNVDQPIIL